MIHRRLPATCCSITWAWCLLSGAAVCSGQDFFRNLFGAEPPQVVFEDIAEAVVIQEENFGVLQAEVVGGDEHVKNQYQAVLDAELYLLRRVTNPTPEQQPKLAQQAWTDFELTMKRQGLNQVQVLQEGMMGGFAGPPPVAASMREVIVRMLLKTAAKCLDEQQVALYRQEIDKRNEHLRQATVDVLAGELGYRYRLTTEQQTKIAASLKANWQPAWYQGAEAFLMHGEQFFPQLPDQFIAPHLTNAQRAAWRERDQQFQVMWGGGVVVGFPGLAAVKWNDDLVPKAPPPVQEAPATDRNGTGSDAGTGPQDVPPTLNDMPPP